MRNSVGFAATGHGRPWRLAFPEFAGNEQGTVLRGARQGEAFPSEQTIAILSGLTDKVVREGIRGLDGFPGFSFEQYVTRRGRRSNKFQLEMLRNSERGAGFPFKAAARLGWLEKNLVHVRTSRPCPKLTSLLPSTGSSRCSRPRPAAARPTRKALPICPADDRRRLEDHFNTHIADGDFFDLDYAEQDRIRGVGPSQRGGSSSDQRRTPLRVGRNQAGFESPATRDHRRKWQVSFHQKPEPGSVRQDLPGRWGCDQRQ